MSHYSGGPLAAQYRWRKKNPEKWAAVLARADAKRAGKVRSYRRFLKSACEFCGTREKLDVHHKDKNRRHNVESNLQTLCRSCHRKEDNRLNRVLACSERGYFLAFY